MNNRMKDLDFEQTVVFDTVKDFEFTRKAAQRFRQVVELDSREAYLGKIRVLCSVPIRNLIGGYIS